MADSKYDCIVIGAGPAGYVAAIRAAQLGLRVMIVERRKTLGGTCLNIGCIPSKALLSSSELYARIRNEAEEHGIGVEPPSLDLTKMMKRKEKVVAKLTGGVASLMKGNKITVVEGEARIPAPGKVTVASDEYSTDAIVLATGSEPAELPMIPFDHELIIDSADALALSEVPRKLIIVGAGIIGLELGSVWARLGAEVEVVELLPQLLPEWDGQVVKLMQRELSRQGLQFHLNTKVTGFSKKGKKATLEAEDADGKKLTFSGDRILVAAGRRPSAGGIDLDELGIRHDKGRIEVDERYATSVEGVYAIGDLIPGPMLAHKAEEEGVAVAEIIAGRHGAVNYGTVPGVLYTAPEAAMVGPTEEALKKEGRAYNKGLFQFAVNGKALGSGMTTGFVKILSDKTTDRLLGAHIVGDHASDLIHEAVIVMEFGGSAEDLGRSFHAHPTLSEAVKEAALAAWDTGIHGL